MLTVFVPIGSSNTVSSRVISAQSYSYNTNGVVTNGNSQYSNRHSYLTVSMSTPGRSSGGGSTKLDRKTSKCCIPNYLH